jgi:hypothetical protein
MWAVFRVGQRAKANPFSAEEREGMLCLEGGHDGYCEAFGAIHSRAWHLSPTVLEVVDGLTGDGTLPVDMGFLFHPALRIVPVEGGFEALGRNDGRVVCRIEPPDELEWAVVDAWFAPGFGRRVAGQRLGGRGVLRCPAKVRTIFKFNRDKPSA